MIIASLLAALPALAEQNAKNLTLCVEDQENHPWILLDRPGYVAIMLEMVSQRTGLRFQYVHKPWKRCLLEMQQNAVDGIVNASFVPERLAMGVYPMRGEQPDTSRRMLDITYSLYRPHNSPLNWDGKQFSGLRKPIGAQTKFSVIGPLQAAGAKVDDSRKDAKDVLRYTLMGVVDGAALLTYNGDRLLAENPEFGSTLEKVGPPLAQTANYLVFSHQWVRQNAQAAQAAWDAVAAVRDSAEFRTKVAPLLGRN